MINQLQSPNVSIIDDKNIRLNLDKNTSNHKNQILRDIKKDEDYFDNSSINDSVVYEQF